MPLILIVGLPCSGKTTRAKELKAFLERESSTCVHIVSENDVMKSRNIDKNVLFADFQKEKEIRGLLKSEALRNLGNNNVVILDAGNYIKGFRYELYCAVKNNKTTQLLIECIVEEKKSKLWNDNRSDVKDRYSEEIFQALHLRYEAPDSRNRWDSPIISLQDTDNLDRDTIMNSLFLRKPPPPNMSSQSTPLSSADYLYELDKITKVIADAVIIAKKTNAPTNLTEYPDYCLLLDDLPNDLTSVQLVKLRRQFLNYTKLHPPQSHAVDPSKMVGLFVQFLTTSLNEPLS